MPWHVVNQGETLFELAQKHGLESWKKIYDHAENREFRQKRPDPGIIFPGDRIFVPNKVLKKQPSAVDKAHVFKVKTQKAHVRIAVQDGEKKPLAGKDYTLEVDGVSESRCLPVDGLLEVEVAVDAREGRLVVEGDDGESMEWTLQLGSMDPLNEICGVQARLKNLGIYTGSLDGTLNDDTRTAIYAFQARQGLEPTGNPDEAFQQELDSEYTPA